MLAGGLILGITGAVLVWAVEVSVAGIDLDVAGWILLLAGVLMVALALAAARASGFEYVNDPREQGRGR